VNPLAHWRGLPPVWRARVLNAVIAWAIVVGVLSIVGMSPSAPILAALTIAGLALLLVLDTEPDAGERGWYAGDLTGVTSGRGSDHRTNALADHLALVQSSPDTTEEIVRRIHVRLQTILESIVWARMGIDLRRNAEWARTLLPGDLADFYLSPPDPAALRPIALDRLLTRIEEL